jgi:pimeloyl-ACP methyl ester carboxylesterase
MPPAPKCAAAPEQCFRVTDHAADIVAFMRAMNIDRANFVGHSLGSLITQEIALANPGMVEKAVLIGTSTTIVGNPVIRDFLLRDTIEAAWKPAIEEKGKHFPQDLYAVQVREISSKVVQWVTTEWASDPVESPDWVAEYVENALSMPAGTWIGVAPAVQLFDSSGRLDDLKVPTLVIWGTQDSTFPSDPDQAANKKALAAAAKTNHTTNYWQQYGSLPLPSSGAQESDIGHLAEAEAPDMIAADVTTGAPATDWVHSDATQSPKASCGTRQSAPPQVWSGTLSRRRQAQSGTLCCHCCDLAYPRPSWLRQPPAGP